MDKIIARFHNFTFRYKVQSEPTLTDIDLEIAKGEKILICGPSGCGKSTIACCLNGLIPASYPGESQGNLTIGGRSYKEHDIFSLSKITGTVLQDPDGQFIGLSVGEDIAFALENDAVGLEEMKARVLEAARKVGMEAFLSHSPQELSGGQKQRVSLAGVMVDDVELFLFDEPLANLDPASGKKIIELIDEIHKSSDAAVVIIEHRLEDVLYRDVDRVVLIDNGRVACDCSPDQLLSTDQLRDKGIREPLYVTALKYAGVNMTEQMRPGRIDTLSLSDDDICSVRSWFSDIPSHVEDDARPVILEAEGIRFSYPDGNEVLHGIDFSVKKGEIISIVGTNGAGKSTFSKILCGFERQDKGSVFLSGMNIDGLSIKERAEHIGYVMQNPNQMITRSVVRDEIELGLRLKGCLSEGEIAALADNAMKVCGLWPFRSWPISALSFGQKKRVTIAAILAGNPEIIILDEPTAGQDFRHYTDIMEFLRSINEMGTTIIMITHDMHLMLEYAERAAVFSDGMIIADAVPEGILSDSMTAEKASLKKTSLSDLAYMCSLPEMEFIRRFISFDREARR